MIIKSKCKKYDIIIDDDDCSRVQNFAPNGWEAKFTTNSNHPYVITRKTVTVDGKRIRKQYYLHRLILNVLDEPEKHIDHITSTLDNRKSQLRFCTRVQNMKNRKSAKNSTSKHLGVYYCKNKRGSKRWRAVIKPENANNIHLGYYYNEDDGGFAYNTACRIVHGEFANLNVIESNIVDEGQIEEYVHSVLSIKFKQS